MHRLTVTLLLLSAVAIGTSQIPFDPCNGKVQPVTPPDFGGYCANRIVIYYQGFPVTWFADIGLIIVWILIIKEKRIIELT